MSNLKYLSHLTAPLSGFKSLNLRGETRHEANILESLVVCGKTVHSTTDVWRSTSPRPDNLHDFKEEWLDESVLMSYGVPGNIITGYIPERAFDSKYKIVQYQDGPAKGSQADSTFLKYHKNNPGSIVATCSFKAWVYLQRLEETLGKENVEWVYGPTVPQVFENHDSFNQTNLLWAYRNFCSYADNDHKGMQTLFNKIRDYLNSNTNLTLTILAQPNNESSKEALSGDCHSWFFTLPFSGALLPFKDRIKVKTNLHWYEMLELFSKTKLVVSPAEPLGGNPFEAGSYGIPMILEQQTNPFVDSNSNSLFPEVLTAPRGINNQFLEKLDNLFFDSVFYNKHGSAYRNFIKQHATYEAYVNKIEEIGKKRGWQ